MRIIHLRAENVKRIKVVDFTPQPHLQLVAGKNRQGKSTVLDSVLYAMGGKSAIPKEPIRDGEDKALIRLDCGEFIVRRTFTRTEDGGFNTELIVLNPAGAEPGTPDRKLPKWGSPQEMLDAILGELSFDPLSFERMKPKEQLAELQQIVKLPINPAQIAVDNAADFKARTDINREEKKKRAQADAIIVPEGIKDPVDESAILDQIEKLAGENADIEKRRANRERAAKGIAADRADAAAKRNSLEGIGARAEGRIRELQRQIADIENERDEELKRVAQDAMALDQTADELDQKLKAAPPLPAPRSLADLRASLDAAKETNAAVARLAQKTAITREADALAAEAKSLTDRIAEREKQKTDAIRAATMPVPGLGFGDEWITYQGKPFDQASGREQLLVSVSIAMAANPKLRVIRIKDGGLLDEDGLKLLADLAEEKDYQVWLERIDAAGEMAIVMEDGAVKAKKEEKHANQ